MLALIRRRARLMRQYMLGMKGLRSDDVLLASYPRSGSTWLRFILFHYIGLVEDGGWDADFHKLDDKMVALGRSDLRKPWPHDALPRFVKTHQPYRMLLFARVERALYLVRDPRDVMVSYFHYLRHRTEEPFKGTLSELVRDKSYGIDRWSDHVLSWQTEYDALLRYEALATDPVGAVAQALHSIHVTPDRARLAEAVERASANKVRRAQSERGISGERRFGPKFVFARSGEVGQWRGSMEEADARYIEERMRDNGLSIDDWSAR